MKTKITNYQSLLIEKQRLKQACAAQEKEIKDNFVHLREMLNPTLMMKEAILEMVPREIRENKILSFITTFIRGNGNQEQGIGEGLVDLVKTTLFAAVLKLIDKYLSKE